MLSTNKLSSNIAFETIGDHSRIVNSATQLTKSGYTEDPLEIENLVGGDFFLTTGIGLASAEGRWLNVNDTLCDILGYSRTEFLAKTLCDVMHPEDWEHKYLPARAALRKEDTEHKINEYQGELGFFHKQGYTINLSFKEIVAGEREESLYSVIHVQDIAQAKKIEHLFHWYQVRHSYHAETQALLRAITDVIVVRDAEGRCLNVLPTKTQNLYRPVNEILGKTLHETLPKTRADIILGYIKKALATQQIVRGKYELIINRKPVYFSAVFSPIEHDRVLIFTHDVTELKEAEDHLTIHALITNNVAEGICLLRASDGIIVYTNPRFEEMFGYGVCELIGEPAEILNYWEEGIDSQKETHRLMSEIERHGKHTHEVLNVKKDGSPFWCRVTTSVLHHHTHGMVYVVIQTDITAEKKARESIDLLQSLTESIQSAESFEVSLGHVLEAFAVSHGWIYAEAWIPDTEKQVLTCSPAFYSRPLEQLANSDSSVSLVKFREMSETLTFALGSGLPGRVWESQQPEWQVDTSTQSGDIFLRQALSAQCGIKASLGLPLIEGGRVIAVLAFFKASATRKDAQLIADFSTWASHVSPNTQRYRVKRELLIEKAVSCTVLNAMKDATVVTDEKGCVRSLNLAAQSLLGYGLNELVACPLADILKPLEPSDQFLADSSQIPIGKLSLGIDAEAILTCKNGEELAVRCSVTGVQTGTESAECTAGAVIVISPRIGEDRSAAAAI